MFTKMVVSIIYYIVNIIIAYIIIIVIIIYTKTFINTLSGIQNSTCAQRSILGLYLIIHNHI